MKPSSPSPLEVVQSRAKIIKETIDQLKNQLVVLNDEYNKGYAQHLREEQEKLKSAVEAARENLIRLESANGVPQIPVPNRNQSDAKEPEKTKPEEVKTAKDGGEGIEKSPKKEKKSKDKPKEGKPKSVSDQNLPIDVGRLDLRIAKIEEVKKHPDADTLYVLRINCGEDQPRTVCSGLVAHIRQEELENRMVVLLCNLKPAKMRGIMSEAMVMCASSPDKVEVLIPPENSEIGDLVYCDGYDRKPDEVLSPKKKIFEAVAMDLHTNDNLEACYKGVAFQVPGKGNILSTTLKNVSVK